MAIFDEKMAVGKSENLATLHPHDLTQPSGQEIWGGRLNLDIWLQFEKKEKNPPGGTVMQKNQKQFLKLLFLHYGCAPIGPRGVKRCARIH